MVGHRRPVIVLFGSSIVQFSFGHGGWGANLADIYGRKADILLRGYAGWNTRRALKVIDEVFPKDAPVQPSLVIVYFGGNDSVGPHPAGLGPHVPLPEYIENVRKIGNHLKGLSEKTRIIFLSTPPMNEEMSRESRRFLNSLTCPLSLIFFMSNKVSALIEFSDMMSKVVRTNETCRIYSEACIQVCKEIGLPVIDLWTAIQRRDDWLTSCFTDGVHFSSVGSAIVVEEILKVLREADWEPSLHWKSLPAEFGEDSPYDPVLADEKSTLNISDLNFQWENEWE